MSISSLSLVGTTLKGRFQIIGVIGAGAIGTVYLAEDLKLRRPAAVKVLRSTNRDALKKFRNEAETAAKLKHPNIPEVFESEFGQYPWYYAMEYVAGYHLRVYLTQRGPIPPYASSYLIAGQLLLALDYAHSQGLSHNDLKPENVLVNYDKKTGAIKGIKLVDFGLAEPVDKTQAQESAKTLSATAYLAPERLLGMPGGPAADYYSYGIILGELITGHIPLPSKPVEQPQAGEPTVELSEDVPQPFVPILKQLLSFNPMRRPDSGAEIGRVIAVAFSQLINEEKRKQQQARVSPTGASKATDAQPPV